MIAFVAETRSQTTSIYERLRVAILELDLSPGERLTERGLESSLDVSRTPVRAALLRLDSEGLVQRSGRGWIVAPIDLGEIEAVSEYREAVEAAAARLACVRATDPDLEALSALLHSFAPDASGEEGHRMGTDFHTELARLSENPFLVRAVQDAMTRLSRTRWLEVRTPATREQAWREHLAVLDALQARDPDQAATRIVTHLQATRERLLTSLHTDRRHLRAHGLAIVGGAPPR
jgi:DNA-binding GntR family transcriptional regulator